MPVRDDAVGQLLLRVVDSLEKLEIVAHLSRARTRPQTTTAIASATGLPAQTVAEALSALLRDRVVRTAPEDGAGWWLDTSGPHATEVELLAMTYDDDRVVVLKLMTELALDRIRNEASRVFADAFLLRSSKKGEPDA